LVNGKRTPFGKFDGSLKDINPVDLTVLSTKAALAENKLDPKLIDHAILGNVIPSSTDTLYVRNFSFGVHRNPKQKLNFFFFEVDNFQKIN
jgi:acetyl-CoA acetyltransferase